MLLSTRLRRDRGNGLGTTAYDSLAEHNISRPKGYVLGKGVHTAHETRVNQAHRGGFSSKCDKTSRGMQMSPAWNVLVGRSDVTVILIGCHNCAHDTSLEQMESGLLELVATQPWDRL